jgi:uncharacterized protein
VKLRFVLDAWAVLAFLQKEEPAAARIKALLEEAAADNVELTISVINLGEVVYRIGKTRGEAEAWETLDQLRRLPLTIAPADERSVFSAARLKMHHTISFADAFAAAITADLDATLVTGDPELAQLGGCMRIEGIERSSGARSRLPSKG